MICAYANFKVKETHYAWDKAENFILQEDPSMNLPILLDDKGQVQCRSNAVLFHLAQIFGLNGVDADQQTQIEMLLFDCNDLRNLFMDQTMWSRKVTQTVKEFEAKCKGDGYWVAANSFFNKQDKWLQLHGCDFFVADTPKACDFCIWEMLDVHEAFAADCGKPSPLYRRPHLSSFFHRFRDLPKLQEYFASAEYRLPTLIPRFTFWSGYGSKPAADAPRG